jgi:hypothetical protein
MVGGALIAMLLTALMACGAGKSPATSRASSGGLSDLIAEATSTVSPTDEAATGHATTKVKTVDRSCVRYTVTGSSRGASITYATLTGTSQANVAVPLTTTDGHNGIRLCGFGTGSMLYISAQNQTAAGDLTCEIRIAGLGVVSRNVAQGAYSIATCQSVMP